MNTCYMCDEPATTKEHVPPKCIFPEKKDTLAQVDYRKDLDCVPSCKKHNNDKSRDDEYLLSVLSSSVTSSDVGLRNYLTKVNRAYKRAPGLAKKYIQNMEPVEFKRTGGDVEQGALIPIEHKRVDSVLLCCARGLFFKKTSKKLLLPGKVITHFALYLDPVLQNSIDETMREAGLFFNSRAKIGANIDVFWYNYHECNDYVTFYMCFYGASVVLVRFSKG